MLLTGCFCCKHLHGKILNHVRSVCLRKLLLVKPNCLTNAATCVTSLKKSGKHVQCIVKRWHMKVGQNILQTAIPLDPLANY